MRQFDRSGCSVSCVKADKLLAKVPRPGTQTRHLRHVVKDRWLTYGPIHSLKTERA